MNYFTQTHDFIIHFLVIFLSAIVAFLVVGVVMKLDKKDKFPSSLYIFLLFGTGILSFLFINNLVSNYIHGSLREIYVYPHQGAYYLTVLNDVEYSRGRGGGLAFEQYLETYELPTGKFLSTKKMDDLKVETHFRIYWNGGVRAWAFSPRKGLRLTELPTLKILATQKEIVEMDPELHGTLRLNPNGSVYDPLHNAMILQSVKGKLFVLDDQLHLQSVARVPDFSAYLYKKQIWRFKKHWSFTRVKNQNARFVHFKGTPVSKTSPALLKPYFIPEFNLKRQKKSRVWVVHQSTLYKNKQILLSYLDRNGQEINRINVSKLLNNKRIIKVLGVYSQKDSSFIFIGIGRAKFWAKVLLFSLYALNVDNKTGRLIKKITYYE